VEGNCHDPLESTLWHLPKRLRKLQKTTVRIAGLSANFNEAEAGLFTTTLLVDVLSDCAVPFVFCAKVC
jgi:hypothetical protein